MAPWWSAGPIGTSLALLALLLAPGASAQGTTQGPSDRPAAAASGTAVMLYPLGDSITFGESGPDAATPGGYRGPLIGDLKAEGIGVVYAGTSTANPPVGADPFAYRHDGHPGYRIDQVSTDLDHADSSSGADGGDWMTGNAQHSPFRPQVTVLLIGTNDVTQSFDPQHDFPGGYNSAEPGERTQFVSDMTARLWHLLGELDWLDPGQSIVLCTIPPIGLTSRDPTAHAYDDSIRTRVVPEGRMVGMRITLADVEASFLAQPSDQPDLIGPDGVHPTPFGYTRMAGVIAAAVKTALR